MAGLGAVFVLVAFVLPERLAGEGPAPVAAFASNIASAESTTFHTTTAAISIGLPELSLTFICPLSKFRTRSETVSFE